MCIRDSGQRAEAGPELLQDGVPLFLPHLFPSPLDELFGCGHDLLLALFSYHQHEPLDQILRDRRRADGENVAPDELERIRPPGRAADLAEQQQPPGHPPHDLVRLRRMPQAEDCLLYTSRCV